MALSVVILAAGKGTRMKSTMPKVLHQIAGQSMLQHVINATSGIGATQTVVVAGHAINQVKAHLAEQAIEIVEQTEQLGTAHAVQQAMPLIEDNNQVLVLYGDVPLIQPETLTSLVTNTPQSGLSLLTVTLDNPQGYGRIVRNQNDQVVAIVEQKDASEEQLKIEEVNTGILAANSKDLKTWLANIDDNNAQREFYLTDAIAMAAEQGGVLSAHPSNATEVEGVNSRQQLAALERTYQESISLSLMDSGVSLRDPKRFDLRGELECGSDVVFDINVVIEGKVQIESGVSIGANCILKDCSIGQNTIIKPNSLIEGAQIGQDCQVGPFARIRPGTELKDQAFIGNFVETKKTVLGKGSKASHLAYIGDATVGEKVNIGAGVITCNYDGVNKFQTVIEDGAFIGSDSQLVAPVTIGKGATVGAGSTVTKDVEADELCISRPKQRNIKGWSKPEKINK